VCQGGLTEAWGAEEQRVVECFAAVAGGSDEDSEIGREAGLANELCEAARAERLLERTLFRLWFGHQDFIAHGLTLPTQPPGRKVQGTGFKAAPLAAPTIPQGWVGGPCTLDPVPGGAGGASASELLQREAEELTKVRAVSVGPYGIH